jgi:hypothetical protein
VVGLVFAHLFQDGAALHVPGRQPVDVFAEVAYHLVLGFRDKAETPLVPRDTGRRADAE